MRIKNICCIGAGYVGGPTMSVIALKCPHLDVVVVDADPEKIKAWNGPLNSLPVYEPGLADIVKQVRGRNLFFSNDISSNIEKAEMIFMAVNTPTKTEGEGAGMAADLRYVESCSRDIAKYSRSDKIVVEKSTLPVRTAEKIKEILEENTSNIHFEVLSNPEFLAEGTAIQDLFKSDRVLVGGDQSEYGKKAIQSLVDIYTNWIPRDKIITTNIWSSELAKLASNAMLAQRISSINSLSALCEKTGAKIKELSLAVGMDHRIGPHFLKASVGFGGSCFKKDILNLVYLSNFYGLNEVGEYWHQVLKINDFQQDRIANKIINHFEGKLHNKKIAILGWAFKPNTNDSRESPAINIAKKLYIKGASLSIFDPKVLKNRIQNDLIDIFQGQKIDLDFKKRIEILSNPFDNIKKHDAIAILTEWDIFKSYNWKALPKNLLVVNGVE